MPVHLIKPVILLLFIAAPAMPQPLSFGLKAGVPLTASIAADPSASASATTNRYIAGGPIEIHLPLRLSLEFDALYRHLHYSDSFTGPLPSGLNLEQYPPMPGSFPCF